MIIGVDKGSAYTKTSKGIKIKSTIRDWNENDIRLSGDDTKLVEIFGRKLVIGGTGSFSTDLLKSQHENTKILTYTAIAESFNQDYIKTNMVIGFPIGLYSRNKADMKNLFPTNELVEISINSKKKFIVFENVEVFPEAAGIYYLLNVKDALIIDIGGLSVDIAYFKNGKLIKHRTYPMGILKLYSKIANHLNSSYDLDLSEWDIEDVLVNGLELCGKKVDLNTDPIIINHVNEIVEKIKLEFPIKTISNVFFAGGGGKMLFYKFKKFISQSKLVEKSQIANAKAFEEIAKKIFSK
ncbi:ParM/StbA family protein [Abyssisolibacter fermentans]|uniref:ParM/StbA family protein n=1 Tax=Abyssisolibacter fermentans TaxID=1766203 RepID=UPI00082AD4D9|nr:ParM/StbA family protein [Abyssisolibacter fermentans]